MEFSERMGVSTQPPRSWLKRETNNDEFLEGRKEGADKWLEESEVISICSDEYESVNLDDQKWHDFYYDLQRGGRGQMILWRRNRQSK